MNRFKKRLLRREPQVGLWLSMAEAYGAEICAGSGFDWLLIDGEHGPNDLRSVLAQLQAVAPYGASPVVRVTGKDPDAIKMMLDIGVTSLLVPMVSSADEARALVRAVRYPPKGERGIGHVLGRASRWGRDRDYFTEWEERCCLLVQLESREALDAAEEIVAVDGIDGVLMGPADLAASIGHPGNPAHPEVQAAMYDAVARVVKAGKAAGALTVGAEPAAAYFRNGCSFVAAGADVLLLATAADALVRDVRALL